MPALSQPLTFVVNSTSTTYVAFPYWQQDCDCIRGEVFTSDKVRGDGYFGASDGLHTVMYTATSDFQGTVKMQATLATEPAESDWFDVVNTEVSYTALDIRDFPTVNYYNFTGNFVWVRGHVTILAGAVDSIQYNH